MESIRTIFVLSVLAETEGFIELVVKVQLASHVQIGVEYRLGFGFIILLPGHMHLRV